MSNGNRWRAEMNPEAIKAAEGRVCSSCGGTGAVGMLACVYCSTLPESGRSLSRSTSTEMRGCDQ